MTETLQSDTTGPQGKRRQTVGTSGYCFGDVPDVPARLEQYESVCVEQRGCESLYGWDGDMLIPRRGVVLLL